MAAEVQPLPTRTPPFTVGFVGFSGAGKTTLAEKVVRNLTERGLKVTVIKDAHHGIDLDRPGKDTYRYREAGAPEVMLHTAARYAILVETRVPVTLDDLLARVSPSADLVVVEGFKREGNFPKIEVLRGAAADRAPLFATDARIRAVATDDAEALAPEVRAAGREDLAILCVDDPKAVTEYLLTLRDEANRDRHAHLS